MNINDDSQSITTQNWKNMNISELENQRNILQNRLLVLHDTHYDDLLNVIYDGLDTLDEIITEKMKKSKSYGI